MESTVPTSLPGQAKAWGPFRAIHTGHLSQQVDAIDQPVISRTDVAAGQSGGDEGNRTPNPRLAKAVLCQLSYVPDVGRARSARPT